MTVRQILDKVYREYEKDADYLDFTDDDMVLWFDLLKDSLKEWVKHFPTLRETYSMLSSASDGDKTTTSGTSEYSAPANFVRPASFITVGDTTYHYLAPEKMEHEKKNNPNKEWFSIKGYQGAYKIVIYPTPTTTGTMIEYGYFSLITDPSGESSTVAINRPDFCVYYILQKLYEDDATNKDLAAFYDQKKQDEIRMEKIEQIRRPYGKRSRANDINGYGMGVKDTGNEEENG